MKLKLSWQLLFVLFFLSYNAGAQVKCGADEVRQKLEAEDPNYKRHIEDMDKGIRDYILANPGLAEKPNGVTAPLYYIPCVVQIITNGGTIGMADNPTDAQIIGAIDYLNKVYDGTWTGAGGPIIGVGDLQVKFVLASKDPNNVATTGIVRTDGSGLAGYSANGVRRAGAVGATETSVKNLSRWDPYKFYNIWIVHKIDGCTGIFCGCSCDMGYIAGFAYFPPPNNTTPANINLDGTLMLASQMTAGEKTLPHEFGHSLNLYHPFEGNTSPGPNTCPLAPGDQCGDTDPITNPQLAPNAFPFACRNQAPYSPPYTNPCVGTPFTDNTEKNYMNYTNCYQLYTANQKARMLASCATTVRAGLASSWANNQIAYPTVWSAPGAPAITPTSGLGSSNGAGILNFNVNGQTMYSLNSTQEGGYLNRADKWYDLIELVSSTTYTMTVTLGVFTNAEQLGVWIDYNNDGNFNNTTEQIYRNTNITAAAGAAGIPITFTIPASASIAAGSIVRMRLVEDLSTIYGTPAITNTSSALSYGQAEDYPIYLRINPTPLTLVNFSGRKLNNAIQLNWKTAQEQNSKEFQVEKSMNGRDFSSIGVIPARNISTGSDYTLTDNNVTTGTYFYRLKMIDQNGSFTYSNIISFTFTGKGMLVKGNPFRDQIEVWLPDNNGEVTFRLLDAKGATVFMKKQVMNQNGTILSLKERNLSSGVYILEATINGYHFSERLLKE